MPPCRYGCSAPVVLSQKGFSSEGGCFFHDACTSSTSKPVGHRDALFVDDDGVPYFWSEADGSTSRDLPVAAGFLGWHQAFDASSRCSYYFHSDDPEGSTSHILPFSQAWLDEIGKSIDDVLLLPPHLSEHQRKSAAPLPPAPTLVVVCQDVQPGQAGRSADLTGSTDMMLAVPGMHEEEEEEEEGRLSAAQGSSKATRPNLCPTSRSSIVWMPVLSSDGQSTDHPGTSEKATSLPNATGGGQQWSNGCGQSAIQYFTKNGLSFFWERERHLIALHLAEIDRRNERQWLQPDSAETLALFHGITKKQYFLFKQSLSLNTIVLCQELVQDIHEDTTGMRNVVNKASSGHNWPGSILILQAIFQAIKSSLSVDALESAGLQQSCSPVPDSNADGDTVIRVGSTLEVVVQEAADLDAATLFEEMDVIRKGLISLSQKLFGVLSQRLIYLINLDSGDSERCQDSMKALLENMNAAEASSARLAARNRWRRVALSPDDLRRISFESRPVPPQASPEAQGAGGRQPRQRMLSDVFQLDLESIDLKPQPPAPLDVLRDIEKNVVAVKEKQRKFDVHRSSPVVHHQRDLIRHHAELARATVSDGRDGTLMLNAIKAFLNQITPSTFDANKAALADAVDAARCLERHPLVVMWKVFCDLDADNASAFAQSEAAALIFEQCGGVSVVKTKPPSIELQWRRRYAKSATILKRLVHLVGQHSSAHAARALEPICLCSRGPAACVAAGLLSAVTSCLLGQVKIAARTGLYDVDTTMLQLLQHCCNGSATLQTKQVYESVQCVCKVLDVFISTYSASTPTIRNLPKGFQKKNSIQNDEALQLCHVSCQCLSNISQLPGSFDAFDLFLQTGALDALCTILRNRGYGSSDASSVCARTLTILSQTSSEAARLIPLAKEYGVEFAQNPKHEGFMLLDVPR